MNGNVQEGIDDYTSMASLFTKAEPQIKNLMDTFIVFSTFAAQYCSTYGKLAISLLCAKSSATESLNYGYGKSPW